MSFLILYRSVRTRRVHPVISEDAIGIMEFDDRDDAVDYAEHMALPDGTTTQIVETDEL